MTETLCPFFKGPCHGNECVMWKNEECLIASFLQHVAVAPEENTPLPEEAIQRTGSGLLFQREEAEVPEWLKSSTPEELADEILDWKRKEFSEGGCFGFHAISQYFWSSKGVETFLMPLEVQLKVQKAESLAEKEIRKKEKEELPSLVNQCVDWARTNGLRRLTVADVETYILEKNLGILQETKRAIYAMANLKLKTGT